MTEKKRRFHRRITKKNPIKGGAKNFFCRDIVKAYKNKVIYLGVDLNWMDLFPSFSYDLSFAPATAPAIIKLIMPPATAPAAATAAPIVFDMTKPKDFSNIDEAIENHLNLEAGNEWNDDNDKNSNFKYILNNVMLPRYTSNKDIGNSDNNTQIGEISSIFLNWKKERGFGFADTNQIEDEKKNVIIQDKVNEKSMMLLIYNKLLEFKIIMKKVLTNVFKQRVRKNIEIMMDIIKTSGTKPINIKRTCDFSVSGKIYFGIRVACNSYTNFELHELIIPDPVIPVMDDLPIQDNFPQLRETVIQNFLKQNEEKIQVHMEDLDGLLLFGSVKASNENEKRSKRGKYGKHNVSFDAHDGIDSKDENPIYNTELSNIFEILRKTRQ
jgi:hypothetical protein